MFNKILLACDGSPHALRSAEKTIEIVKNNPDALIHIVYVVDHNTSKSDILAYGEKAKDKRLQKFDSLENILKNENINYKKIILKGEPGPEIVKFANENQFDLVVLGSRGLNALQEMVLGSVSHKVAKRVACPVLIVK